MQGDGEWGLQPVHHTLSLQILPPLGGDSSSHYNPPPASPRWVLSMGCSFSSTVPAWVPSMGCSPLGTDCYILGFPWSHSLLWAEPPALAWGPLWAAGGMCSTVNLQGLLERLLSQHGGLQGNFYSNTSLLLTPFTDLGVCISVSLTSHPSLCCRFSSSWFFSPFLNTLLQRCYHCCQLARLTWSWGSI